MMRTSDLECAYLADVFGNLVANFCIHRRFRKSRLQQCLSCLGDLMLLQPTNTFHVLRHAETLYTLGEYGPAYMGFCRALEMAGKMSDGGLGRRAGYGIKLCLRRLGSLSSETDASAASLSQAGDARKGKKKAIAAASTTDGDDSSLPKRAKDVDAMVAEQLLQAYSKGELVWLLGGVLTEQLLFQAGQIQKTELLGMMKTKYYNYGWRGKRKDR